MKPLLFTLMFAATLFADNYPQLFAQLATPLYKTGVQLQPLVKHEVLKTPVSDYSEQCKRVLEFGKNAEKSADSKEKTIYLKKLRGLQEKHDSLSIFLQKQLSQSMDDNDYPLFLSMVNTEADLFFERPDTKEEIYRYYNKHRNEKNSSYLDRRIKRDEKMIRTYNTTSANIRMYTDKPEKRSARPTTEKPKAATNSVIVLSKPGCSYCLRAKQFLDNNSIRYTEYNIKTSSEGRRLFQQHNGRGVPLLLINGNVIRGFDVAQMRQALR